MEHQDPLEAAAESEKRPLTSPLPPSGELFRTLAEGADYHSGAPCEAAALWNELLSGDLQVADWFYSPERWFITFGRVRAACRAPIEPKLRSRLAAYLLADAQKAVAHEHGISCSTVSSSLRLALAQLGIAVTPSKAPPILWLLARRGHGSDTRLVRCSTLEWASETYVIASVARPELVLSPELADGEFRVLCRIVEGKSYSQIASERRTSCRTVANQVSGGFRKLKVSGRVELIQRLMDGDALPARARRSLARINYVPPAPKTATHSC